MRRSFATLGRLLLLFVQLQVLDLAAQVSARFPFEVSETVGIRRRSDVISTRLLFERPLPSTTGFRLEDESESIPCQLRPAGETTDGISALDIDFVGHFQPFETRRYQIVAGVGLEGSEEPQNGLRIEESSNEFRIKNRDYLVWTIRKDLKGLFRFLRLPNVEYVVEDSGGLGFRKGDGAIHLLSNSKPTRARILREGALACALEFDYENWPGDGSSRVVLEFPRTKSWVHVTWTIRGMSRISELVAELQLSLKGEEKLVDFGSGDFVYNTVRTDQVAVMEARPEGSPRWSVLHGLRGDLKPLVVAPENVLLAGLGGWVHLMDETRCTALAVAQFGLAGEDRIEVDGTGLLRITRRPKADQIALEFWVHFVSMPVHIGARTSPQSMQSPLSVRWLPRVN